MYNCPLVFNYEEIQKYATQIALYSRPSAKRNAIIAYIGEIVETLRSTTIAITDMETAYKAALNGAETWQHYSESGNSLVYNWDIAQLNFTPKMAQRALGHNNNSPMYLLTIQALRLRSAWSCVKVALRAYHPEL